MSSSHAETLQIIYVCCAAWVGLCIGSFINVVVYRLPIMLERRRQQERAELTFSTIEPAAPFNLSIPRSRCPSCGHQIRWFENIPVLSYIALSGRCSSCKIHISRRYPMVEAFTGILFAFCIWMFGVTGAGITCSIVSSILLAQVLIYWDLHANQPTKIS